jgi:assimilatory nitrate reductase catalytic subunit
MRRHMRARVERSIARWLPRVVLTMVEIAVVLFRRRVTNPYCALQCGMHLSGSREDVRIAGNAEFPVNNGGLCVKGWSAAGTLAHPDRLTTPLIRDAAGTLRPASWDSGLKKTGR